MVHLRELSAGFSLLSALVSFILLGLALGAFRHNRRSPFAFLAAAFGIFAAKSLIVAYSVWADAIHHDSLELIDAVGDLTTILLLTIPIFWKPSPA